MTAGAFMSGAGNSKVPNLIPNRRYAGFQKRQGQGPEGGVINLSVDLSSGIDKVALGSLSSVGGRIGSSKFYKKLSLQVLLFGGLNLLNASIQQWNRAAATNKRFSNGGRKFSVQTFTGTGGSVTIVTIGTVRERQKSTTSATIVDAGAGVTNVETNLITNGNLRVVAVFVTPIAGTTTLNVANAATSTASSQNSSIDASGAAGLTDVVYTDPLSNAVAVANFNGPAGVTYTTAVNIGFSQSVNTITFAGAGTVAETNIGNIQLTAFSTKNYGMYKAENSIGSEGVSGGLQVNRLKNIIPIG